MAIDFRAALQHAGQLQRVVTLGDLVAETHEAVVRHTRYRHAWLVFFVPGDTHARLAQVAGTRQELAFATCPLIPIAGDAMAEEIVRGRAPVVVVDARTDPRTNKDLVARMENRTIINIPLVLGDDLQGALGIGTYGDAEGVVAPTDDELEWLTLLGLQLAAAYSRLRVIDEQHETEAARIELERHLEALQRVELMGVLASGVAHDLNNYLTIIRANVDLLDRSGTDEVVRDIRLAAKSAAEVTGQLLSLGRARARRWERVHLGDRVAATVQLVRSSLPADVQVVVEAERAPSIEADPVQVDQVLANLIINARDAVGSHGTIRVGAEERELGQDFAATHAWARPGRYGRVWVRDSGEGIAPEHLARIFDPLFSTKSRGTGLGLAVVARVVEQHAGLIHCDSTPGHGTTFDVYLPLTRAA